MHAHQLSLFPPPAAAAADFTPTCPPLSVATQVKMVLIPKREEFSDSERIRLWWGRDDYARFRQVLIDWKRANAHRISHSDNILSINLSDIDEEEEEEELGENNDGQDDEAVASYIRDHQEAAEAADAIAAAAEAGKAAEAAAAAAVTAQAAAVATAAAAAAATAAEVAALNAEEVEKERLQVLAAAVAQQQQRQEQQALQQQQAAEEEVKVEEEERSGDDGAASPDAWEAEVSLAKAMAAAVAAAGGGISGGLMAPDFSADDDSVLSDVAEGDEGLEDEPRIGEVKRLGKDRLYSRKSFTCGTAVGPGAAAAPTRAGVPDWSSSGGSNGTFPLRRSQTFGEEQQISQSPPSPAGGGRLKAVPLSEAQVMTESLRTWRKNFDARNAQVGGGDDDGELEDRGRAMSLQQQTRNYAQRGRATALVLSRTKWASDVAGVGSSLAAPAAGAAGAFGHLQGRPASGGVGATGSGAVAAAAATGGGAASSSGSNGERSGGGGASLDEGEQQEGGEKHLRALSDQEWSAARRTSSSANEEGSSSIGGPVLGAFDREMRKAATRQAEVDAAQAARAAAMVKAAAAAAAEATAAAEAAAETKPTAWGEQPAGVAGGGSFSEAVAGGDAAIAAGAAAGSVVELGLNDAPGSAAAASAAGLRIATDGVSNLSLRAKDSVENLQELGEHSWGPLPLSSSA